MPTATPSRSPRVIDGGERTPGALRLPDSWLRGVLAGAEGVLGTWLLLVVPAVAVYIATAAAPQLGTASWVEAARIGTGVWLTAHGAHLQAGEVTFTLIPLGASLTAMGLTAAALRRAALDTWTGVLLAALTYLAGTVLLGRLVAAPGAYRAVGGAVVIVVLAAAWGMRGRYPASHPRVREAGGRIRAATLEWFEGRVAPETWQRVRESTGSVLRAGWATGLRLFAGVGVLGTIAVVVSAAVGLPLILAVHDHLQPDVVSAVVLTGAQLLMLPTLIVWASAYLSGAGFAVGVGTLYSPAEVVSAPLPAIPILGALPNPEAQPLPALGYVYLVLGALAGWYLHRRLVAGREPGGGLVPVLAAAVGATAVVLAGVGLFSMLATGGFGPDRFAAEVGPRTGAFLGALAWQVLAPMIVVIIAAHPTTHSLAGTVWGRVRRLLPGGSAE